MSSGVVKKIEQMILNIVQEYDQKFFYSNIIRDFEHEGYTAKIEKESRDMTGKAEVITPEGDIINYDVRYNRITAVNGERYSVYAKNCRPDSIEHASM